MRRMALSAPHFPNRSLARMRIRGCSRPMKLRTIRNPLLKPGQTISVQAIAYGRAFFITPNNPCISQHFQMLRDGRLRQNGFATMFPHIHGSQRPSSSTIRKRTGFPIALQILTKRISSSDKMPAIFFQFPIPNISIRLRIAGTEIFPPLLSNSVLTSTRGSCAPVGMGGQLASNMS